MPDQIQQMSFPQTNFGGGQRTPVDTSMYQGLNQQQPINLLGMMGQAAQTQNAFNQNKLFNTELKARKAVGAIMQNNIDPQSGEVDFHKAAIELSTNPDSAYIAPDIISKWFQNENVNKDIFLKDLDARNKQNISLLSSIGGLTALGNAVTREDLVRKAQQVYGEGLVKDPKMIAAVLANAPESGPKLNQYVTMLQRSIMEPTAAGTATMSQLQSTPYGGGTALGTFQPATGEYQQIGKIPSTMGPAERVHIETINRGGVPVQVTAGALADAQSGGANGQAQPIPQSIQQQGGDLGNIPAVGVGLSPEQQAYQTKRGTDTGEYVTTLNENAAAAGGSLQNIGRASAAASKLRPGGGASYYQQLASVADALGLDRDKIVNPVALGDRAAVAEFNKAMLGLVQNQIRQTFVGAGGIRIAAEYSNMTDAFPSTDMPPEAIKSILGFMDKQARLVQAKQAFYNKWVNDEGLNPDRFAPKWEKFLRDHNQIPPLPTILKKSDSNG